MTYRYLQKILLLATLVCIAIKGAAQKGLPSETPTVATVNTFFPKHLDFKEVMLKQIKVPTGFKVTIAATGLNKPRMMAMLPNGDLYVTRRDQGDVLLLKDTDGDGRFDELKTVVSQFTGVHGIAIKDGMAYLCSNKILKRYTINNDNMLSDTVTIFDEMPDGGQHPNRTIAFGGDGKLYISVGSDCNDCNESNPEHATLLQVNLDSASRRIYARGLRNTIGFDWHPKTKELWGMDNGTDWRGEEIPGEELNKIIDGGVYGWPLVYGKQQVDNTREDPIGSTKAAFAKTTQPAVLTFPAHAAPINFTFLYNFNNLPEDFKDDALVSWHGSWNRKKPEGYKVQRIKFQNGQPVGIEDFFTGFLSADGSTRFGRPAGLLVTPKAIYISDDENGVIYSVTKSN